MRGDAGGVNERRISQLLLVAGILAAGLFAIEGHILADNPEAMLIPVVLIMVGAFGVGKLAGQREERARQDIKDRP